MKSKKQVISEHYKEMGRKGGNARAAKLSAEERRIIAIKGGLALQKKIRMAKIKLD